MMRRVGAIIGIFAMVGLAMALIWRVYLHHQQIRDVEEVPAVVEFVSSGRPARAPLVVRVAGTVPHDTQKDMALQIVRNIEGVRQVRAERLVCE